MEEKISFNSKDGLKLSGVWSIPNKKTDKAIILAHGITVDKDEDGVFTGLAELLQNNGLAVLRFDFRGHGESEGRSVEMTIAGELLDLKAAVEETKRKGYAKIGLLGASFGGGISALYAAQNQNKLKCLCLWNPCLNYNHCFFNPTLPWIRARKGHMKKDLQEKGWTTLGSRKFVLGKQLFEEMANLLPHKEIRKIKIPLVIIHGDKDTHVPYEDSQESVGGMANSSLLTIRGGEHGFHKPEKHRIEANTKTLEFFQKFLQ